MTKTRIAAVLVAAPLLLAACAGDSGTATSPTSAAGSAAAASSAGGVAGDLGSAQPGQTVDKDAFVEAVNKGTAEAKTYALDLKMDMSGEQTGRVTMTGVADVSDQANPKMKMSMELPGAGGASSAGSVEMILVDKVMYMKAPGSAGKYFKMTMDQMSKLSGQDLTAAMNPTAQLDKMKSAMKQVTFVGEEDVNGVHTRHYKATIDAAGVTPSPSSMPSGMSLPSQMPYDIWLDEANRTRKFTMDMSMGAMTIKYEGTMDKFGEPVSIAAPPASQVQPMPTSAESSN